MPPRRSVRRRTGRDEERTGSPPPSGPLTEADIGRIFNEHLAAAIPTLVAQIQEGLNTGTGGNPSGGSGSLGIGGRRGPTDPDPPQQGCTYKYFASCNPPTFSRKGGATGLLKWIEEMENKLKIRRCFDQHKTEYAASSLKEAALIWWNNQVRTMGAAVADVLPWVDFVRLIKAEYCPANELQKLKEEFWQHSMVGADLQKYVERFHELACLLPTMFSTEEELVAQFIKGLNPVI